MITKSENNHKIKYYRDKYVDNVKNEMVFFNFGLPPNHTHVNLKWKDVIKQFRALKELLVRLNVYQANGKTQAGSIPFPEARRIIDYNLDENNIRQSYIRFRSTRNHTS